MGVDHYIDVGARAKNFRMDRPLGMAPAAAGDLSAVPIDQHEIVGAQNFAQPDLVALHPNAAAAGPAHREVAQGHVAVPLHVENPAGARRLGQALARCGVHVGGGCHRYGTTAVASISTLAKSSTSATTCTSVMVGKCLPITAR